MTGAGNAGKGTRGGTSAATERAAAVATASADPSSTVPSPAPASTTVLDLDLDDFIKAEVQHLCVGHGESMIDEEE